VNGEWVPDEDYADLCDENDGIYNISPGGFLRGFFLYPEDEERTRRELEAVAEEVARECPFARTFGVVGEGEGVVWKVKQWPERVECWFKIKGGRFRPTFAPAPRKLVANDDVDAARRDAVAVAARTWCDERRMEQGWDYLREKGLPRGMKGLGPFLKWVQVDIFVEEKGYIDEHGVDVKMLKREIDAIAKPWFWRGLIE
jgi:hypothetical protein